MILGGYRDKIKARREAADRARARRTPETAFVLSGGGVLGAVQAGQIQALLTAGIRPDVVVGSSVGALNAAFVACKPDADSTDELIAIWRSLKTEDIFPGSRFSRAWNIVARGDHIYPNEGLRRLVERLPVRTFEECVLPLSICATNLTTGAERWFSEGPLMRAILASTALPAIFPPVSIDGDLYVDGGVVNNAPVSRAVEFGAKKIYVLTCGTKKHELPPIRRPLDVLVQAFAHARHVRLGLDLERFADKADVVVIPGADVRGIRYNDLSHTDQLITAAREATTKFLAERKVANA
ncbi:MAG: patatin-like phospholipase family protein [Actinomycetota bacterium]|nr:patatin-like phospholipase family protein [Actinomycetota bacterium]